MVRLGNALTVDRHNTGERKVNEELANACWACFVVCGKWEWNGMQASEPQMLNTYIRTWGQYFKLCMCGSERRMGRGSTHQIAFTLGSPDRLTGERQQTGDCVSGGATPLTLWHKFSPLGNIFVHRQCTHSSRWWLWLLLLTILSILIWLMMVFQNILRFTRRTHSYKRWPFIIRSSVRQDTRESRLRLSPQFVACWFVGSQQWCPQNLYREVY